MRERLVTLVCALGALAVFATLFFGGRGGDMRRVVLPTSVEHRRDGLLGAATWLKSQGLHIVSLRERFDTLSTRHDLAATGNLLILALPAAVPYHAREFSALDTWLHAGNSLLLLAPLADRPAWGRGSVAFYPDLKSLTGLDVRQVSAVAGAANAAGAGNAAGAVTGTDKVPDASRAGPAKGGEREAREELLRAMQELPEPARSTLVPNRPHAFLQGVKEVAAWSDYAPQHWQPGVPRDAFLLSLAHERDAGNDVLWIVSDTPSSTIILSGFGSLFSNRSLGLADNARLLGNIIAGTVGPGGAVLFDDEHQGLTAAYDPEKFYRDPRLYATLAILLAVWITWVIGSTRLRLPARHTRVPREVELVRVTGGFLARVLKPAAAARRMFELFFARLRARTRFARADGASQWEWLEGNPRLARGDLQQLKDWYALAYADQQVPLTQLHNLLVQTERRLVQ